MWCLGQGRGQGPRLILQALVRTPSPPEFPPVALSLSIGENVREGGMKETLVRAWIGKVGLNDRTNTHTQSFTPPSCDYGGSTLQLNDLRDLLTSVAKGQDRHGWLGECVSLMLRVMVGTW